MSSRQVAMVRTTTAHAHGLGFDLVAITPAAPSTAVECYQTWLDRGYHGDMAYLARPEAVARRADPARILSDVRSVLVVAANYHTRPLPPEFSEDSARGVVASYAWGDDYHDLLTPRLDQLTAFIEAEIGGTVAHRSYVDTGPILERDLAVRAGLGFVGKNSNLIHPRLGSWLFLGELLLAMELPPSVSVRGGPEGPRREVLLHMSDSRAADAVILDLRSAEAEDLGSAVGESLHASERASLRCASFRIIDDEFSHSDARGTCGNCTRCLDACPTGALVAPYVLDARRCISYLTIELKGPIPRDMRPLLGNRIFGCDICQEVCPWNRRHAQPTDEPGFQPRAEGIAPRLLDLLSLDEEGFRKRFQGSPVKRAKRRGLLRNVAVALGNGGDPAAVPALVEALRDAEPLIRGHAAWALGHFGTGEARRGLEVALGAEEDEWVREELAQAL